MPLHRTAIFTLHHPTRHTRAVLDHALATYTHAYSTALHSFRHYTAAEPRAMATIGVDAQGEPHNHHRKLEQVLFQHRVPALEAAMQPLEGGVRESLRRHVARTLLSFAELAAGTTGTTGAEGSAEVGSDMGIGTSGAAHDDARQQSERATARVISHDAGAHNTIGGAVVAPPVGIHGRKRRWHQERASPPTRARPEDAERFRRAGLAPGHARRQPRRGNCLP